MPWPPNVIPSSYIGSLARISTCAWAYVTPASANAASGSRPRATCRTRRRRRRAGRRRRGDPGALDLSREALALVADQGDRHREAALRNNLADTLHRGGREEDAMDELKRAVAIFAEIGGHDDEPRPGVWQLVEW